MIQQAIQVVHYRLVLKYSRVTGLLGLRGVRELKWNETSESCKFL